MGIFKSNQALIEPSEFHSFLVSNSNGTTPDIGKLQEAAYQLIFVYDRLQIGFDDYKAYMSEHSARLCTAFTNDHFVMFRRKLGLQSYPILQRKDYVSPSPARIKGELHYISTDQLIRLDKLRENGVQFKRELIEIYIPHFAVHKLAPWNKGGRNKGEYMEVYGTEHPTDHVLHAAVVKAFAYIAEDSYWDDQIDGGYDYLPVTKYEAHNRRVGAYYHFSKRDFFE